MQTYDIEYSVDQKREGKLKVRMYCLLGLYLLTLGVGIFVVFKTVFIALGAIIPLVLYTLYLCTWRFVNVEQKYAVESGDIIVYRKFGNSKSKRVLCIKIKSAKIIAPISDCEAELSKIGSARVYNALPSLKCDNAYAIIYEENGVEKALLIQVIERTLKSLRYYNEKTLISSIK